MSASTPLWPAGVQPLVGAEDPELEAWCRRFAEECEASAAGSDSDHETFLSPSEREAREAWARGRKPGGQGRHWRVKAAGAGAGITAATIFIAWILMRGSTGSDVLTMSKADRSPTWLYGDSTRTLPDAERKSGAVPTPSMGLLPSYANIYEPMNPLRIETVEPRSKNYFIIIGDWGKAGGPGTCQYAVAGKLKGYVEGQKKIGKNLLFIASVGDNFYWTGVTPEAWEKDWQVPYGPNDPESPLYQIPWLAIYGNHDFGEDDPYALCPQVKPHIWLNDQAYAGGQFNKDRNPMRPDGTESFWMPDYNYHYEIPKASLEVIAVDTNGKMDPNLIAGNLKARGKVDQLCGGRNVSQNFLDTVARAGDALVAQRAKISKASTVLVIQHYPGLCPRAVFENALPLERRGKVRLICAYGHVHDQRCDVKGPAGCMDVLSGGGGGCCGPKVNLAGFTAVHLDDQGGAWVDVDSAAVRMEKDSCSW